MAYILQRVSEIQEKCGINCGVVLIQTVLWSGARFQGHHRVVQAPSRTQRPLVSVQSWSWTFVFIIITIISPSSSRAVNYIAINWYILKTLNNVYFPPVALTSSNCKNQSVKSIYKMKQKAIKFCHTGYKELYWLKAAPLSPIKMCFLYNSHEYPVHQNAEFGLGLGLLCLGLGFGVTGLCSVCSVSVKAASTTIPLR